MSLLTLRICIAGMIAAAGVLGYRLRGAVDGWRAARQAGERTRELAELAENDAIVLASVAADVAAEVDDAE